MPALTISDFFNLSARCRACSARISPDEADKLLDISAALIDRLITDSDKRREKQQADINKMLEQAAALLERSSAILEQVTELASKQAVRKPAKKPAKPKEDKPQEEYSQYGEYGNVRLTDKQYKRLAEQYGEGVVKAYIDDVDCWCQQQGKPYKDYSAAIRKFIKRDKDKGIKKEVEPAKSHSYDPSKFVDAFGDPINY